jgi:hypothetical protein
MTGQKQTSTERVKAHLARKKEHKQLLASKGLVEVPLIVKIDQVIKIENAAKMLKTSEPQLLYSITQRPIAELCQEHDNILIRNSQAKMEMLSAFAAKNSDFVEMSDLTNIIGD